MWRIAFVLALGLTSAGGCSSGPSSEVSTGGLPPTTAEHRSPRTTTSTVKAATTSAAPSTNGSNNHGWENDEGEPTTATAKPTTARVVMTVKKDRNQIDRFAIASAPTADFGAEALRCANVGKKKGNERYCYVYPTEDAFRASSVQQNGDQDPVCWVAFAGGGIHQAKVTTVQVTERWSYELEKLCPKY